MKLINEEDVERMQNGDMSPLKAIFDANFSYCVQALIKLFACSESDAKDMVVDAILVLREKIMTKDYSNENVRSFLLKVASNKWKNQRKRNARLVDYDPILLGKYLSMQIDSDESANIKNKVQGIIHAIHSLGDPCTSVLQLNLVEGLSLEVVYQQLGYNSKGVLKTTKSRCMKKLLEAIKHQ